jgi:hypothetical protein
VRIVGGSDYYDGAAMYGVDTDVVFVRHKDSRLSFRDCPISCSRSVWKDLVALRPSDWRTDLPTRHYDPLRNKFQATCRHFVVAGKLYPCLECVDLRADPPWTVHRDFTMEGFVKTLDGFGIQLRTERSRRRQIWRHRGDYALRTPQAVLARTLTEAQVQWLIERRVTVMYPQYDALREPRAGADRGHWRVDPFDLRTHDFQRVLDPFQAHQEIAQWVSGVLPRNPNPMVSITDDAVKAATHGMDKTSFRRPKENAK